jgi:hypothetical protein
MKKLNTATFIFEGVEVRDFAGPFEASEHVEETGGTSVEAR